jgi:hypothetical protein
MEDFSFITENCNESKMFRNNYLSQLTLRDAVDSVFLNLLTVYLLSKEFETKPFAQDYARRTMQFGNFNLPRVSGTDLYQGLHIILNPEGAMAGKLKAHEQNTALAQELKTNKKMVLDFLRNISTGRGDTTSAIRIMYRLEGQMGIDISNYKSLRRLITDWDNLSSHQRELCVTRLLQYYKIRGKHSELYPILDRLAAGKGYVLHGVENAELAALGVGAMAGSRSSNGFLSSLAKVAAMGAAGYAIGRNL